MKEKPILFNGEMVRAILDGRKTMTRRVVTPQPVLGRSQTRRPTLEGAESGFPGESFVDRMSSDGIHCPYGAPGTRLWVRETFGQDEYFSQFTLSEHTKINRGANQPDRFGILYRADKERLGILYRADKERTGVKWKPSIHMPRWASRITLEVTGVRVERVQDISEEDAKAEGITLECEYYPSICPEALSSAPLAARFAHLWNTINGECSAIGWQKNPWVWVVEFERTS